MATSTRSAKPAKRKPAAAPVDEARRQLGVELQEILDRFLAADASIARQTQSPVGSVGERGGGLLTRDFAAKCKYSRELAIAALQYHGIAGPERTLASVPKTFPTCAVRHDDKTFVVFNAGTGEGFPSFVVLDRENIADLDEPDEVEVRAAPWGPLRAELQTGRVFPSRSFVLSWREEMDVVIGRVTVDQIIENMIFPAEPAASGRFKDPRDCVLWEGSRVVAVVRDHAGFREVVRFDGQSAEIGGGR